MWPTSAHSSLSNIAAATKPRSQTDPAQCTQEHHRQCPQHPHCDTVAEEDLEPLSSAVKIPSLPFQESGSQSSAAATPVQEIQQRQPRARVEAINSSSSRSQTPSTLCRQYNNWPPYSARSTTRTSTPIRAQRNSRPSNISLDAELLEKFGHMGLESTASSMVSLTTSSSDLEQWSRSGSTDEQEMNQLHCKLYFLGEYTAEPLYKDAPEMRTSPLIRTLCMAPAT